MISIQIPVSRLWNSKNTQKLIVRMTIKRWKMATYEIITIVKRFHEIVNRRRSNRRFSRGAYRFQDNWNVSPRYYLLAVINRIYLPLCARSIEIRFIALVKTLPSVTTLCPDFSQDISSRETFSEHWFPGSLPSFPSDVVSRHASRLFVREYVFAHRKRERNLRTGCFNSEFRMSLLSKVPAHEEKHSEFRNVWVSLWDLLLQEDSNFLNFFQVKVKMFKL